MYTHKTIKTGTLQLHPGRQHFLTWLACCSDTAGTGVVDAAGTGVVTGAVTAVTNVDGAGEATVAAEVVAVGSDGAAAGGGGGATGTVLRWLISCEQNFNAESNNCPDSVWNIPNYVHPDEWNTC